MTLKRPCTPTQVFFVILADSTSVQVGGSFLKSPNYMFFKTLKRCITHIQQTKQESQGSVSQIQSIHVRTVPRDLISQNK